MGIFKLIINTLIVQQGYKTKTQLQRLAEGNVVQDTPLSKKSNKKKGKNEENKKLETPLKTGQQKLETDKKRSKQHSKNFVLSSTPHINHAPIFCIKLKRNGHYPLVT